MGDLVGPDEVGDLGGDVPSLGGGRGVPGALPQTLQELGQLAPFVVGRLPGDRAGFLLVTFDDVSDRQAIARAPAPAGSAYEAPAAGRNSDRAVGRTKLR